MRYIRSFFPGLDKNPTGLCFIKHRGGYTLSYTHWAYTIIKTNGKWHFFAGNTPSDNFTQLMIKNASTRPQDLISDPPHQFYNKVDIENDIAKEWSYKRSEDLEYCLLIDGAPINNRPITASDKYNYLDDPFSQISGGMIIGDTYQK